MANDDEEQSPNLPLEAGPVTVEFVPISAIRMDGSTQSRAETSAPTVAEYAEAIERGDELPPAILYRDEDGNYWPGDGHHTILGYQRAGRDEVPSRVRSGTQRDAILHSVGANAKHGLKRSNADKRHAIEIMLDDPEWSQWTERQMAKACNVSHTLVANIKRERSSQTEVNSGNIATLHGRSHENQLASDEEYPADEQEDQAVEADDDQNEAPEGEDPDEDEDEDEDELYRVAEALVQASRHLVKHCTGMEWLPLIRFAGNCADHAKVRRAIEIMTALSELQTRYASIPRKTTQEARRMRADVTSLTQELEEGFAEVSGQNSQRLSEWDRIVLALASKALTCAQIARMLYGDATKKHYSSTLYILRNMAESQQVRQSANKDWELAEEGRKRLQEVTDER